MAWKKCGLVFVPPNDHSWMKSHAQVPLARVMDAHRIRVWFATRDAQNRSQIGFIDVSQKDPTQILQVSEEPALVRGELGCFDDAGVMPSSIVDDKGALRLYYTGWNGGGATPFRNSIGVATTRDGGVTFDRMFRGPIVDRSPEEPFFCAMPLVHIERERYRMWYLSCIRWHISPDGDRPEPVYHLKYAESADGLSWKREGRIAIDLSGPEEGGLVRPTIAIDEKSGHRKAYKMWFSRRGLTKYRSGGATSYRLGYAESEDLLFWTRMDARADLDVSPSGWDSEMVAYPCVVDAGGRRFMFFNGNGFGQTGFGVAEWVE